MVKFNEILELIGFLVAILNKGKVQNAFFKTFSQNRRYNLIAIGLYCFLLNDIRLKWRKEVPL